MSEKKRKRKMSKRSKTSRESSSGEGSSRPRRREWVVRQTEPITKLEHEEELVFQLGYMGLQNLDESAQERWRRNLVQPERLIQSTRFLWPSNIKKHLLRRISENPNAKSKIRRILREKCTNLCKNDLRTLSHFEKRKRQKNKRRGYTFQHSRSITSYDIYSTKGCIGIIGLQDENYGLFEKVAFWQFISNSTWEARLTKCHSSPSFEICNSIAC